MGESGGWDGGAHPFQPSSLSGPVKARSVRSPGSTDDWESMDARYEYHHPFAA